ncbi:MAG TPA: LptA/OstA family protein [Steroidobacteraceae bacterium]|nr:LptA/OstA family protein [Steroidobacteraceae bacterium]
MEFDYAAHRAVLRDNVVLSQGDLRLTADRCDATGFDTPTGRWTCTGDVHLTSELRGQLQSDEAVVEFRDNRIQSALATGHPAQFEQTSSATGLLARGHADSIDYQVAAGTIRLTTDAWLRYGDNGDITAPVLIYSINDQKLIGTGSPHPGERVHGRIVPKKVAPGASKAGAKPGSAP